MEVNKDQTKESRQRPLIRTGFVKQENEDGEVEVGWGTPLSAVLKASARQPGKQGVLNRKGQDFLNF